jgi:hypothetical protein
MIGKSDTTLAAMLWEEGLAPADAAEHWGTSSVTRRIKRLYANRLGGNWDLEDLEGTGPVANWRRQIAEVRNSAIDTGREVTSVEVNAAGVAAGALSTFMAQRYWPTGESTRRRCRSFSDRCRSNSTSQPRHAMKFCGKCSAATRLPCSSTVGVTIG